MPHGQAFFYRACGFSAYSISWWPRRKKSHQSYEPYPMMVSATIGTWACQQQVFLRKKVSWIDSIQNIPDRKDPIHCFSLCFFFLVSAISLVVQLIQYMHLSFFIQSILIPSAHFGTSKNPFSRSALEEAKSAQISERIALLALADADHLQKSFSSASVDIQGRQSNQEAAAQRFLMGPGQKLFTSCDIYTSCSHTAPKYLPGILFWAIFWDILSIHACACIYIYIYTYAHTYINE